MNIKALVISLLLATSTVLVQAAAEPANIHQAAASGNIEAVQRFLERNPALVNLQDTSRFGETPLHAAALNGHIAIVQILLEHGANPNVQMNECGETPLFRAALHGRTAIVQMLLEHGATNLKENIFGQTPLIRATYNGCKSVVRLITTWELLRAVRCTLLMGLHPRTGANSPIFTYYLPQYVLQQIAQFLRPEHFADQR